MATEFTVLYPRIRTLLGDFDSSAYLYSNEMLDAAIRLALDQDDVFSESVVVGFIEPDVTVKQDILRLSARAALALLEPSSGAFAYRTPTLSVTRGGASPYSNIGRLRDMLRGIVDGDLVLEKDTDWDQLLEGPSRVAEKMGTAGQGLWWWNCGGAGNG